ncbi:Heat Labile Enterotoxin Type Iib [Metarhizium guizhouense ARSEF 977]|uniref:Heat Labile Enterotoxin Type Iib n=1 Tax=Metarhizium guizhouense (strain ARSEF 977) TaxID=1276136 RepID=A0A0B4H8S3_METGA|nr:Heat Labile Enterotoxin Type Iib [Metarhizium guizhouense ARSEF 977]
MKNFAALLFASALAVPLGASQAAPPSSTPPERPLPSVVYRGDDLPPEYYKNLGGIPHEFTGKTDNRSYSLWWHNVGFDGTFGRLRGKGRDFNSAYAATSTRFSSALYFAVLTREQEFGWMYQIHATPNMIDLDNSGFRPEASYEKEFAALGGIRWEQIEAWLRIPKNLISDYGRNYNAHGALDKWALPGNFTKDFPDLKWETNPDYNPAYNQYHGSEGQPQLGGKPIKVKGRLQLDIPREFEGKSMEYHAIEFMNKVGGPVGWTGSFPLNFSAPADFSSAGL